MDIAGFLLILGASARLTRLVTHDEITEPLRLRAGSGWFGFALHCPWCVGLWISAITCAAYLLIPGLWFTVPAAALTANLIWAQIQDSLDMAAQLYRERTEAHTPPTPGPVRGRGARHTTTEG